MRPQLRGAAVRVAWAILLLGTLLLLVPVADVLLTDLVRWGLSLELWEITALAAGIVAVSHVGDALLERWRD